MDPIDDRDSEYGSRMAGTWDLLPGDTSQRPDRSFYLGVIQEGGEPVLDVGCGAGRLLLDFLGRGIDIEGLDKSPKMLDLLREKAAKLGLDPAVYLGKMEEMGLPRRYRTIFVPSSAFQRLVDPESARQALQCFYNYLEPGGVLAMPFSVIPRPEGESIPSETHFPSIDSRVYTQEQALTLLQEAGFVGLRLFHEFTREPASPEDTRFTILCERPIEYSSAYVSSISADAEERVVETHPDGSPSRMEYMLNGKLVGRRWYDEEGSLYFEVPIQEGLQHGRVYRWDWGSLTSMEPFVHGLPHGVEYQWGPDGSLLGTYAMERGTGIDLWFSSCTGCPAGLSEVYYMQAGQRYGWEWWINSDQQSVSEERHWQDGQLHGIERCWNSQGRLRRGYPRYWIRGQRVTRRQYLHEAAGDTSLPPFRVEDNQPQRGFPPEIRRYLKN